MWKIFLFILLLDCLIVVIGGTIWVVNVIVYELTGIDLAKKLLEKLNKDDGTIS